mmetsp:Transcript_46181/g.130582  ORF Transcript_46181/g.130582 Transcript_46181/m.130582 type:complete len:223 (-) Transcript_46181:393-1061(-)
MAILPADLALVAAGEEDAHVDVPDERVLGVQHDVVVRRDDGRDLQLQDLLREPPLDGVAVQLPREVDDPDHVRPRQDAADLVQLRLEVGGRARRHPQQEDVPEHVLGVVHGYRLRYDLHLAEVMLPQGDDNIGRRVHSGRARRARPLCAVGGRLLRHGGRALGRSAAARLCARIRAAHRIRGRLIRAPHLPTGLFAVRHRHAAEHPQGSALVKWACAASSCL